RALWVGPFPSYPRSMLRGMSDGAERRRATPPRDGWCRYAMMPAPRWHHHHMCGVPEYFGWDLGELCDAVRERGPEEWADPVDHRTAVLVAHHRAKDAGDERLADEMSRIDASLFEYVRDERGVGVRYLDSEHIEWIRRDPPPASEYLCQVIYVTEWTEVPAGSIRFESRGGDPHAVLRIPSHYARVERDLRTYITRRFNERREDWGVVDAPCLTEEAEAIAKRIDSVSPDGYVWGHVPSGTILLERELALDWAEAARLLNSNRSFADLHRSEEHTSELQSRENLVCRLLLEKKKHGRRCSSRE